MFCAVINDCEIIHIRSVHISVNDCEIIHIQSVHISISVLGMLVCFMDVLCCIFVGVCLFVLLCLVVTILYQHICIYKKTFLFSANFPLEGSVSVIILESLLKEFNASFDLISFYCCFM